MFYGTSKKLFTIHFQSILMEVSNVHRWTGILHGGILDAYALLMLFLHPR